MSNIIDLETYKFRKKIKEYWLAKNRKKEKTSQSIDRFYKELEKLEKWELEEKWKTIKESISYPRNN